MMSYIPGIYRYNYTGIYGIPYQDRLYIRRVGHPACLPGLYKFIDVHENKKIV